MQGERWHVWQELLRSCVRAASVSTCWHGALCFTVALVQPLPCQEIPGSWTCYTVKEKDILFDLVPVLNNSEEDLIELKYPAAM